jgi:hypothetical protein
VRTTLMSVFRKAVALPLALAAIAAPAVAQAQPAEARAPIGGVAEVGQTIWVGAAGPYQWQRCGGLPYAPAILADGPTAYYRLGDSEESDVVTDATGGEASGTFLNGVDLDVDGGPFEDADGAAAFDGVDDAIVIPDGKAVDLGGAFTLEVWARQEAPAAGRLLDKGAGGYRLALTANGTVVLSVSGGGDVAVSAETLPADGLFHHVVATKEGPSARIFLDGVDVTGTTSKLTPTDTASALEVASSFRGELDELALYRGALAPDQVRAHFDLGEASCASIAGAQSFAYSVDPADLGFSLRALAGDGAGRQAPSERTPVVETRAPVNVEAPVVWGEATVGERLVAREGEWAGLEPLSYSYRWQACFDRLYKDTVLADSPRGYWRLGELSGATAKDASGTGNKGTYANGVGLGAPGALGAVGDANRAARFDGVNDHVTAADKSSLDLGNAVTIEAWIKRSRAGLRGHIVQKGVGTYALWLGADDRIHFAKAGTGDLAVSTVAVPADGAFHHVVATKSGGTIRLYLDGGNVTQAVANHSLSDTDVPLQIGRALNQNTGTASSYFPGELDEVAVYGHALSAAAVRKHHAMATSGCTDLAGAGATARELTPGVAQLGARLRVVVTAANAAGSAQATSGVTQAQVGWGGDPVIAGGTLSNAEGVPVAGAAVSLHLWPSGGEDVPVGGDAGTVLIAETTSDASGNYVLRSPVTPVLREEADANGGVVNLELRALANGLLYETFIERDLGSPDGEQGLAGGESMWIEPGLEAPGTPARIQLAGDVPEVAATAGISVEPPNPGVDCSDWDIMFNIWKKTGQGEAWTRVGELHTWSKMTNWLMYGHRADSTIDVAFKTPTSRWFLNGTVHVSRSNGASSAAEVKASSDVGEYRSRGVRAKFIFTNWYQCGTGNKRTKAEQWNGYSLGKKGRVYSRDGECSDLKPWILEPGQVWQRTSEKARYWRAGADLGFFTVGARSGYSTWVRVRWQLGHTVTARTLCGVTEYPDRAETIYAGW